MIRARMPFLDKLAASMRTRDSILCVGLDPEPALIPESLDIPADDKARLLALTPASYIGLAARLARDVG